MEAQELRIVFLGLRFRMTLTQCPFVRWWVARGFLYVCESSGSEVHRVLTIPPGVLDLFREIVDAARVRSDLKFAWLDGAGGRVGFFAPGLVAMGEHDIHELTSRVFRDYYTQLTPYDARWLERYRPEVPQYNFTSVWWTVVRVVLAHEVGHALQREEYGPVSGRAAEDDADVQAGIIASRLGWESELDRFVMHAIGCRNAAYCTHAPPDQRVKLYDNGHLVDLMTRPQW